MTDSSPSRVPTGIAGETMPFDAAWTSVRDALLRGLTHALSNRVMAIATLAELSSGSVPDARAGDMLTSESRRLDTLLRQFRMLCSTDPAQCEPVHLGDLLPPLVALGARHPEAADLRCEIDVGSDAQPAWGDPVRIQRVVLMLLLAATRAARRIAVPVVRVRVWGDDHATVVSTYAGLPGTAGVVTNGVEAEPVPGTHTVRVIEPADGNGGIRYDLVLPTLAVARRRGA